MNILQRLNTKGDKITFYYDYGRERGQRPSTGIYIVYNCPNILPGIFKFDLLFE